MTHSPNIVEIPALLQAKISKRIVFAEEGLTIGKPLHNSRMHFFASENIAAFRFGIKELRGFSFTFGRQYYIEIKDFNCKITRIKLNSIYGLKNKTYYRIWADLLQNLWDFYLEDQLNYYTELYNIQQLFELAGVTFHPDGISWGQNNRLPWDKIGVKSYRNYFMIHHVDNPRLYKCCVFSIDWNAVVLQSLLKEIVKVSRKVPKRSSF